MEIGNEISQKIRSAIKAKLVELGAYVDEELPDYIMVMVANKKSLAQMTDDLSLFLGTNTDKFTTWLHGLLVKLQSITSDPISVPSKSEKSDKTSKSKDHSSGTSGHESKSNKSSAGPGDSGGKSKKLTIDDAVDSKKETKKRKLSADKVAAGSNVAAQDSSKPPEIAVSSEDLVMSSKTIKQEEPPLVIEETSKPPKPETLKAIGAASGGAAVPELSVAGTAKEPSSSIQVVEEDDLSELLLTETDELTEELELEAAVVPVSKKSESKTSSSMSKTNKDTSVTITLPNLSSSHSSGNRPKAVTSPIRQTASRTASVRPVESRPTELFTRKRRGPVSVVASVSKVEDEEEDDGYDPYNPAVGSVASVIKVTARKSSIPPKLQANKSLLLKAMNEAEKSVETQRRVAITPVRPIMRSEKKEREREPDRPSRASQSSARESQPGSRLARSSLHQVIGQSKPGRKSDSPPVYIPTRKVQPAPRGDVTSRLGIVSKSKREEAQRRLGKQEKVEPINFVIKRQRTEDPDEDDLDLVPVKKPAVVHEVKGKPLRESESGTEVDSRVVEYEPEVVASPAEDGKSVESGSQGIPEILDVEPDEFVLDPDLEAAESSALYDEDKRLVDMAEKQKDKTRFVVTLDGVDEEEYEMSVLEGQEVMEGQVEGIAMDEEPVAMTAAKDAVAPSMHRSPPKVQQFSINLKDSDEEAEPMQEETTPLMRAKMMERCKFWPACVNGAACEYHHPTIQCKTFPQCKFGDKCLYIHPNCRYDSKCLRPDCPYTHSGKRSIPAAVIPVYRPPPPPPPPQPVVPPRSKSLPQCRFFPQCSNMACPYFHPKPCRFGFSCKNKEWNCPFFHPSLPTKDKLTWQAGKTTAAPSAGVPPPSLALT